MLMMEAFIPGIKGDFALKLPLKNVFIKIKFSRRPYPRSIKSPVKVSPPYHTWFGRLIQTNTDTHTQTEHVDFIILDNAYTPQWAPER